MAPVECPHTDTPAYGRVCRHLLDKPDDDYCKHFTGDGAEYELLCWACLKGLPNSKSEGRLVCSDCFHRIEVEGYWDGMSGQPRICERLSRLDFEHEIIHLSQPLESALLDIQPVESLREPVFVGVTSGGEITSLDFAMRSASVLAELPTRGLDLKEKIFLHLSPGGSMAAVVNTRGQHGAVIDLSTGMMTLEIERTALHQSRCEITQCDYPLAFFELDGRLLLVHGTIWNRLDISEPRTGMLLTERTLPLYVSGPQKSPHYLDYFHCGLTVSPDQTWIADDGWIWSPVGAVTTWNLQSWINDNVWESEDGASRKQLCTRDDWDLPRCWLDGTTLVVSGYGPQFDPHVVGVRIFDVVTGKQLRWFPGPDGQLAFDTYLFSFSPESGTSVWDVDTGERLLRDPDFHPIRYHHGAKCFLSLLPDGSFQLSYLRDG